MIQLTDPTLVDLKSNFFVLCTNMKVCLYNYLKWVEPSMKESVKNLKLIMRLQTDFCLCYLHTLKQFSYDLAYIIKYTVKPVLSSHFKKTKNKGFQEQ